MQEDINQINALVEADLVHKKHVLEQLGKNCSDIVKNINMNNAYFNIFMLLVILIEAADISYIIVLVFLWIFDLQELVNQVKFHKSLQYMENNLDKQQLILKLFHLIIVELVEQNDIPGKTHYFLELVYIDLFGAQRINECIQQNNSKAKMKLLIKLEIIDCIIGILFKLSILLYFENKIGTLALPSLIAFGYFFLRIMYNMICRNKKLDDLEAEHVDSMQLLQAQRQTNSFYFIIVIINFLYFSPFFLFEYILQQQPILIRGVNNCMHYSANTLTFGDNYAYYSIQPRNEIKQKQNLNFFVTQFLLFFSSPNNNWVFRIYFIAQAIFYSLKIERYIDWNWSQVFWIYWVFFCIVIGITLIIFLLLVVKVCDFCGGAKGELIEIQGLFWFLLITGFISANSSYSILVYTDVLSALDMTKVDQGASQQQIQADNSSLQTAQNSLIPILYIVTGGFCIQILYFLLLRKQISAFVKLIMYEYGEDDDEEQGEQIQQNNQNQRGPAHLNNNNNNNDPNRDPRVPPKKVRMAYKSKLVLEEKEVVPTMNLPQFVSKVSSTYFKFLMNKKDVQKEMVEKKVKPIKPNIQKNQQGTAPSPHNNASKNMQGRGFSTKSMNRSAIATITINTQGNANTQADMLQSSRLNTQEKQFPDQNDFEDVFKDGNSGSQDKKDLRNDNFLKKNYKAMNKQKFVEMHQFKPEQQQNSQKFQFPANALQEIADEIGHEGNGYQDKTNIFSPLSHVDLPINQRRQISMADPKNNQIVSAASNKAQKDLNMTAPFVQNHINEEEEHESYYYDRQSRQKQKSDNETIHNEDIIRFDDESQANSKMEVETSQMAHSLQQSVSTCLVCFDAIPDSIFNPCGHGGLCYECAIDLMKKTGECYLCRQVIIYKQSVFKKKIEEILKIDIESKNQGIMKIVTTTKLVKVREKIEITEQEYQYYSAIRRNRRQQQQSQSNQQNGGVDNQNNNSGNNNGNLNDNNQQQEHEQEAAAAAHPADQQEGSGANQNLSCQPIQNQILSNQNMEEHNQSQGVQNLLQPN